MALRRSREILGGVPVGNWGRIGGCEVSYRRYKGLRKNIGGGRRGYLGSHLGRLPVLPWRQGHEGSMGCQRPKKPLRLHRCPILRQHQRHERPQAQRLPRLPGVG